MKDTRAGTAGLLVVMVLIGSSPLAGTVLAQDASTYTGTNISFAADGNAIADYAVADATLVESLSVQSTSEVEHSGVIGLGGGIESLTSVQGSAVTLESQTTASATLTTESGATLRAHDNPHGILVVHAGDESQYVIGNVSSDASVEQASENRVVVTTGDGTKGTFIATGDGTVTVNEEGNVSASLGRDESLVFRAYPDGRTDGDEEAEQLIADGTATAEVSVTQTSDGSGAAVADAAEYGSNTSVEVTQTGESTVRMTADRSTHRGTVILASVSRSVIESGEDLEVTVDGDAAVRADSKSELRSAVQDGEHSTFMVRDATSASASTEVLVGVNHFSEREITMDSTAADGNPGGSETTDGSRSTAETKSTGEGGESSADVGSTSSQTTTTNVPGFGFGATILSLAGLVVVRLRQDT